jgi:hypothetical protein
MRTRAWPVGAAATAAVTAVARTAVSLDLAALTGLAWGVLAWTYAGYPEAGSLSYEGLAGSDRWLAAMSLVASAAGFATVSVVASGETETVLYANLLAVVAAVFTLGALVEART